MAKFSLFGYSEDQPRDFRSIVMSLRKQSLIQKSIIEITRNADGSQRSALEKLAKNFT